MTSKFPYFIILFIIVSGCKENNPEQFIPHIEGYWQIEEVIKSDGTQKEYNFSNTVDYFEVTDSLKGFRKKLKPNFIGTFETSKSVETFQLKIDKDSLNVYYSTPYSQWKETIISADENHLRISNTNNDVYLYKRYQSININELN